MREIYLKKQISDEEFAPFKGAMISENSYDLLIDYDCDVYDEETGKPLLKFRKNYIPANYAKTAYDACGKVSFVLNNRGTASGTSIGFKNDVVKGPDGKQYRSKTSRVNLEAEQAKEIRRLKSGSGIVGYFDKTIRIPYCRQTSFNANKFDEFKKLYPIIKFVNDAYKELAPEHYKKQRAKADETNQDFVIKDTAFTTVTVNRNWQTAVHKDSGDFAEGFGNLVVLRAGEYKGGYFVLPQWKVAVDMNNCDLLLCDVHQWHCNTPLVGDGKKFKRYSLVMYYRDNMIKCGTSEDNLDYAKNRVAGDSIYPKE